MAIIELNDFSFQYTTGKQPALQHITFSVEEGEFIAVIGPNGSGKSTLCYTIAGFIPHFFKGETSGSVKVDGMETLSSTLAEMVLHAGLVFQNPFNQISGSKFTVYEEIAFGLENLGVPGSEMAGHIDEVMAVTGIRELADRSPYALSGGQQQRVALASILVMQPRVMVLDEPTSQLDPIGTREVFQVVRSMTSKGITIIMAEHKVEHIAAFADRVIVLDEGKALRQGTVRETLTDPMLPECGVGVSRFTAVAQQAQKENLWPVDRALPVTLEEATDGFREVSRGSHAH
ncbi:MAG TPA: ABC transporter ATP-binding protein [Longilinea sp.]|nr:ABC transporter ATP-binding protein [Longilinea sp.]